MNVRLTDQKLCFSHTHRLFKSTNLGSGAKKEKKRVLYFLEFQKFEETKGSYFNHFWPLGRDIEDLCF